MGQVAVLKKELNLPQLYTVNRLSYLIKLKLEGVPAFKQVPVVGQLEDVHQVNNHLYFALHDEKAVVQCVFFDADLEEELENGMEVVVLGKVSCFEKQSRYQLQVQHIIPVGEGQRALKHKQRKRRLAREGLFAEERKKTLPRAPQHVGIITAKDSAAWGDVLKTVKERFPYITLHLRTVMVQGDKAVTSLIEAIHLLERSQAEVILMTRGGGSSTDLSVFDDTSLVRAVAFCTTPLVTAVGHDRDVHLVDHAADASFATPTYAMHALLPDQQAIRHRLEQLQKRFSATLHHYQQRVRQEEERKRLYLIIGFLVVIILGFLLGWLA